MSDLVTAQQVFARLVGKFLTELPQLGYQVTLDEAYRPRETAELYAQQGRGSKHSLHTSRLAIDLNLWRGESLCTTRGSMQAAGDLWKSYGPTCRWGGDFEKLIDPRHFSLEWEGRA